MASQFQDKNRGRHMRGYGGIRSSVLRKKRRNMKIYEHEHSLPYTSVQFSSVAQSCPALWDPMNCRTPGLPVHHQLPSSLKLTSIELVMPSRHLILCCPLFLLPPIPPSIRVFSNESTLRMRWPKYWSFSFSIIPSKELHKHCNFQSVL